MQIFHFAIPDWYWIKIIIKALRQDRLSMPHQSLSTYAPIATTFLIASASRQCQAVTYPNKRIRIITGFALGSQAGNAARIHDSKLGEEISQSTALEPLSVKPEYELWGNLINTINFTAQ